MARDKRDRMTNDPVDKERMNAPNLPIFQSCYLPISQSCNLANQSDEFHLQFMGKLLLSAHLIIKMFMSNQHCDSAYVKICPNLNMHFRNFILSHKKPPNARHTFPYISFPNLDRWSRDKKHDQLPTLNKNCLASPQLLSKGFHQRSLILWG